MTRSQGSAADTATALDLDPWALDKLTSTALGEWVQSRLETHVPVDNLSDPSSGFGAQPTLLCLAMMRLPPPLESVARSMLGRSVVCDRTCAFEVAWPPVAMIK